MFEIKPDFIAAVVLIVVSVNLAQRVIEETVVAFKNWMRLRKINRQTDSEIVAAFLKKISNSNTGLVRVDMEPFNRFPFTDEEKNELPGLPLSTLIFLKPIQSADVAAVLLKVLKTKHDYNTLEKEKIMLMDDQRRGITIASYLFQFDIPRSIFLLDQRTILIYKRYLFDYQVRSIPLLSDSLSVEESHILTEYGRDKFRTYIQLFSIISVSLLRASIKGRYVSWRCYLKYLEEAAKQNQINLEGYTEVELKIATTAFAAVSFISIPIAYVEFSDVSKILIKVARMSYFDTDEKVVSLHKALAMKKEN